MGTLPGLELRVGGCQVSTAAAGVRVVNSWEGLWAEPRKSAEDGPLVRDMNDVLAAGA